MEKENQLKEKWIGTKENGFFVRYMSDGALSLYEYIEGRQIGAVQLRSEEATELYAFLKKEIEERRKNSQNNRWRIY